MAGFDNLIRTNSAINAIIFQRIWPLRLPEDGTYPALTYQVVVGTRKRGLADTGLQKWRIQVDCYADTASGGYGAADALRDTVIEQLDGYAGTLSDGTYLQLLDLIGPIDLPYEGDVAVYRAACEFYLYFNRQ